MKKHLVTAGIILVFLAGLSILLYPTVASYVNSLRQSRVVSQYYRDIDNLNTLDFKDMFTAAHAYNEELRSNSNRFNFTEEQREQYMQFLNPGGRGVMGALIINSINVKLPIYHGTDKETLQLGAGHLEGTSLPVGGESTHSVVTGHRGLPSSILLTDLDKLVIGDTFILHILNQTLTYQIDRIIVVEPEEFEPLFIKTGEDYCTLITCTPYGINSHRLLLRGRRVDTEQGVRVYIPVPDAAAIRPQLVALIILIPVFTAVTAVLIIRLIKLNRKGRM